MAYGLRACSCHPLNHYFHHNSFRNRVKSEKNNQNTSKSLEIDEVGAKKHILFYWPNDQK